MTTVSGNRTQMSLNNVQSTSSNTCLTQDERHHYDIKTIVTPMRNDQSQVNQMVTAARPTSATSSSSNNHQPNSPPNNNTCSYDSDITMNTTASMSSTSATAMRRLYFKTAKLNKTTPNSITTLHQQQHQYVPKVKLTNIFFFACISIHFTFHIRFFQVMVMGTSVASTAETTINTSTESASTLATNVTGTDTSTCDSLDLGLSFDVPFFTVLFFPVSFEGLQLIRIYFKVMLLGK